MTTAKTNEPILEITDDRFVMFPLQYADVWELYKKQVDCFPCKKYLCLNL